MLERAHFSYYALLPKWDLCESVDSTLASLNAHVYLLWIPDKDLRARSLLRSDREAWNERFVSLFGSEAAALDAIRASQNARYEAIHKSALPHTVINTGAREWDRYAREISEREST